MSIVTISDLHIKSRKDDSFDILINFLNHPLTENSSDIFLLGDIFDLLCGNHREYFHKFSPFFDSIKKQLNDGKFVHYFEGNHDLHLAQLFESFINKYSLPSEKLRLYKKPLIKNFFEKRIYFSHGDEIKTNDKIYPYYKKVLNYKAFEILSNSLPVAAIDATGEFLSKISSNFHKKKSYNLSQLREYYRNEICILAKKNKLDICVIGHNHLLDKFVYSDNSLSFSYLNNGLPNISNCFIFLNKDEQKFIYI